MEMFSLYICGHPPITQRKYSLQNVHHVTLVILLLTINSLWTSCCYQPVCGDALLHLKGPLSTPIPRQASTEASSGYTQQRSCKRQSLFDIFAVTSERGNGHFDVKMTAGTNTYLWENNSRTALHGKFRAFFTIPVLQLCIVVLYIATYCVNVTFTFRLANLN